MTRASSEIVVEGVRSPVTQEGPVGASEAVVFVHGTPGASEDWSDLLPRVGQFARAVAADMPGYGRAEKPADFDYTVGGYARHLDGLLQQLGVSRAHLVLHDFGGAWGLAWAAQHPAKLASATLLGTGALVGYRWHHWARIWRTPVLGELFMAASPEWAFSFLIGRENPRLPREALAKRYAAFRPWPTKRAVLKLYRATPESLFAAPAATLRKLNRPALVLWPTADRYIPTEQAEYQRDAFPSARIELIEGGGHWFFVEDPERVASLVIPFIREQFAA